MLEVSFFEAKLEQLKTATNGEGRQWLRGLIRDPKKWTRAMPVNAIVSFTFYRLVAWFNERHARAMAL